MMNFCLWRFVSRLFSITSATILISRTTNGNTIQNSSPSSPPSPPSPSQSALSPSSPFQRKPNHELPKLRNDLLIRSLTNQPTERVPVWCMRQAGRHLPEFRSIAQEHDFFTMCENPELAVEISLQPLRRYGVDAVILFSDILVIPKSVLGMPVEMVKGVGPVFSCPCDTPDDAMVLLRRAGIKIGGTCIENEKEYDHFMDDLVQEKLGYVLDSINLARQRINGEVPLIGFCGGPFSLLMFMVEGSNRNSNGSMKKLKRWLYQHPSECHAILQSLSKICVRFLLAQKHAGAQALQVFESVAVDSLTRTQYKEFVLPYLACIARQFKDECKKELKIECEGDGVGDSEDDVERPRGESTPLIAFSRGTDYALEDLATETHYDCLGIDWTSDPKNVRERLAGIAKNGVDDNNKNNSNSNNDMNYNKALQGNMDPCVMYTDISTIRAEVDKMLDSFGTQGYVANFGHGCLPDMDPEHVCAFIKHVQQKSLEMNMKNGP